MENQDEDGRRRVNQLLLEVPEPVVELEARRIRAMEMGADAELVQR